MFVWVLFYKMTTMAPQLKGEIFNTDNVTDGNTNNTINSLFLQLSLACFHINNIHAIIVFHTILACLG